MRLARRAARSRLAVPAFRRVPNINLLRTVSTQKQLTSVGRYSLVLLLISGIGLAFLLYRQNTVSDEKFLLAAQLSTLRSQISTANAQKSEVAKLQADIERLEIADENYQKLISFNSWSRFLTEVQQRSASAGVTLTTVKQKADGAVVSGWSPAPKEALAFVKAMGQASDVAQSSLSSLSKPPADARFSFTIDITFKEQPRQ